jgi:hypothetical protein
MTQNLKPDEPALLELKQSLVRLIAELEVSKSQKSAA